MSGPLRFVLLLPYLVLFYPLVCARRAATRLRTRHTWRSWISENVAVGGFVWPWETAALTDQRIGAVVNVTHEMFDPVRAFKRAGIAYLRVPCWDGRAPSPGDAARAVGFVADQIRSGRRVYIHCASGVGRSVVIAVLYLAMHEGRTVATALALVGSRRPQAHLSRAQRAFVDRVDGMRSGKRARVSLS